MFFEVWMVIVLGLVYIASLVHTNITAYRSGVTDGSERLLELLEERNLISVDSDGELQEFPYN